jgi:hypothetical protein
MNDNVVGWITLKTKIDNKDLKIGLKDAEKKLEKYEKEAERLNKQKDKNDVDMKSYEEEKKAIKSSTEEDLTRVETEEQVKYLLEMEQMQLEKLNDKYSGTIDKNKKLNELLEENKKKQEDIKKSAKQISEEIGEKTSKGAKKTSNSLTGILKKFSKWSLALMGIRSLYGVIATSANSVLKQNKDLASSLEYIQFALGKVFEPVIKWIVNAIMKLLVYLGAIIKKFSGINIFSKATLKDFKNTNKEASKLNKTLAGFDEMNVLSSNTGSSSGTPSIDLGKEVDKLVPDEEVTNVKSAFEEIYKTARSEAIETFLGENSIWSMAKIGAWDFVQGFTKIFHGLVEIVSGIWDIIVGIFTGNYEKIGDGLKKVWNGLLDVLKGIPQVIWGIIEGLFGLFVGLIDKICKAFETFFSETLPEFINKAGDWIGEKLTNLGVTLGEWGEKLFDFLFGWIFDGAEKAWNTLKTGAKGAWEGIKSVFSKVGTFFSDTFKKAWEKVKNIFSTGGKIFTGIKDGIVDAFKNIVNKLIDGINKVVSKPFNTLNSTLNKIRNVEILGIKPFSKLWSNNPISVPTIPKLAKGGVINLPGKGVAIGGERGPEGVIPLTDSQMMEQLGEAIGRYITVNLTNNTNLDGRVIARQTSRISSNTDFIRNR